MTTRNTTSVGRMNPRLWKELRMLGLPVVAAAVFACLIPVFSLVDASAPGDIFSPLKVFSWLAFLGCVLFIAAAPVGWEFQHRTFSMLLSQPFARFGFWRDKMLAASLWAVGLCLAAWFANVLLVKALAPQHSIISRDLFGGNMAPEGVFMQSDFGFLLLFVPASLCAAPVLTLLTRSTVGGVTFTIATQFLAALLVSWVSQKLGVDQGVGFVVGTVLYSLGFLWVGWRMFSRLQVTDAAALIPSTADETKAAPATPWWGRLRGSRAANFAQFAWLDRLLRCGSTGATANLFRKELRLQKPVYQVGALYCLCWVAISALVFIQPMKGYENLYDIIFAFHVPLVFLLAGSVSASDENTLGVSGWHLTLPIPAAKQWAIKLAGSAAAGVVVGWVLPLVLFGASSLVAPIGQSKAIGEVALFLVCTSAALFVMSFWAVSLVGNTVRAVMTALIGLVVLFLAFMLAHHWALAHLGVSARFALALAILVGAPPGREWNYLVGCRPYAFVGFPVAIAAAALWQTFLLYRRPDAARKPFIVYAAVLLFGALLMGAVVGSLEAGRVSIEQHIIRGAD